MGKLRSVLYYFTCWMAGVLPALVVVVDEVGRPTQVTGYSMRPTLNPWGSLFSDVIWLNSRVGHIKPGDVVALRSPVAPGSSMVKRVVGVEGETVRTLTYRKRYVQVPQGHLWVEGDNIRSSQDSNFYGPVSAGLVCGRATHILWPPSRCQRLTSILTEEQRQRREEGQEHDWDNAES